MPADPDAAGGARRDPPPVVGLVAEIRAAWSLVPAPPTDEVKVLAWGWGEQSWRVFVGVAPLDVDIDSAGFLGCTPLLDLPPRAAAAYLGPYLLSIIAGLQFQAENVVFYDLLTRAHLLHCLSEERFWTEVVRAELSSEGARAVEDCCVFLAANRGPLALPDDQCARMLELARR